MKKKFPIIKNDILTLLLLGAVTLGLVALRCARFLP